MHTTLSPPFNAALKLGLAKSGLREVQQEEEEI